MSEKKRWDSIDFIKGLACIAVVFIHFNFPGDLGIAVRSVCKFGVPVFFFVSGFFLGWMPEKALDANKIVKKIKHILIIVGGAATVYAFYTAIYRLLVYGSVGARAYVTELVTAAKICKFFVQNDVFCYGHLWFLFGLIYCYLFVLFVPLKKKMTVGILGTVLMVVFLLLTIYHDWFPVPRFIRIPETETVVSVFNLFFFRALGFFLIGMFLRLYNEKIVAYRICENVLIILAIIGCCISVFERFMLMENQFYFGSYITFLSLAVWAIRNPKKGNKCVTYIGKELSLFIYVLHIAIGNTINLIYSCTPLHNIFEKIFGEEQMVWSYISTFLILGITTLISFCINKGWKVIKNILLCKIN